MDSLEVQWRHGGAVLLLFSGLHGREISVPSQEFAGSKPKPVAQWTRFEAQFTSSGKYDNPVQKVQLKVEFIPPSGKKRMVLAFWDRGKTWRVRFSPNEKGKWMYRTRCSREATLKSRVNAEWFGPATGWRKSAGQVENKGVRELRFCGCGTVC